MTANHRRCVRDDRGGMSIEAVLMMLAITLLNAFTVGVFLARGSVLTRAGRGLIWMCALAAVMGLVTAAGRLSDWTVNRANTRIRRQLGPLLSGWLGRAENAPLTDQDLREWRRARRAGVTIREAQRWSDRGLPYPVAGAARRAQVSLDTALSLAEAMRDAQLWDGVDRDVLSGLLAGRTRHHGDGLPPTVIHRWARFTPDQVRRSCRAVLGDPTSQPPDLVPSDRASINASKVLAALEAGR